MKVTVHHSAPFATDQIAEAITQYLDLNTVIVCIGSDKIRGDSLAPLIGTLLSQDKFPLPVYGKIGDTVQALNLERIMEEVKEKHPTSTILGIDACMGETVGNISVRDYPVSPGKGLNKNLPQVGVASIVGTVAIHSVFDENEISTSTLYGMANTISTALQVWYRYEKAKERV